MKIIIIMLCIFVFVSAAPYGLSHYKMLHSTHYHNLSYTFPICLENGAVGKWLAYQMQTLSECDVASVCQWCND